MEGSTALRAAAKGETAIPSAEIANVEEGAAIAVVEVKALPDPVKGPLYILKSDHWESHKKLLAVGSTVGLIVTNVKNLWTIVQIAGASEEAGSKGARAKMPKNVQQHKAKLAREEEEKKAQAAKEAEWAKFADTFGTRPFVEKPIDESNERRQYYRVEELTSKRQGISCWVRGRVHLSRPVSSALIFLVIRHQFTTMQVVIQDQLEFIKFAKGIYNESIVDIYGTVRALETPLESVTIKDAELVVQKMFVVSMAIPKLPLEIEAASRPEHVIENRKQEVEKLDAEIKQNQEAVASAEGEAKVMVQARLDDLVAQKKNLKPYGTVHLETRLDNRVLDLRTPANLSIFRIQSGVCRLFREILTSEGFVEIHTPKLISGASEGGAEVFKCNYFEQYGIPNAYLAQSPQLYKQMAIAGDFERVFEIGPVFRREDSNTHRHMTEFMGLDLEMSFKQHYHEVLDVMDKLFVELFRGLETQFSRELDVIREQHPFAPLKYLSPSLRLQWPVAIALLQKELAKPVEETVDPQLTKELLEQLGAEGKKNVGDMDDLSTKAEKLLGRVVAREYHTDFYILDRFPSHIRPFYTMPDPTDEQFSNSYDLFLRGEEICSGAQRIHNAAFLKERAEKKGVPASSIKDYIDCFDFGAEPHGGGGVGLERVVMLYLGIGNIRKTSMFPRDPKRLTP